MLGNGTQCLVQRARITGFWGLLVLESSSSVRDVPKSTFDFPVRPRQVYPSVRYFAFAYFHIKVTVDSQEAIKYLELLASRRARSGTPSIILRFTNFHCYLPVEVHTCSSISSRMVLCPKRRKSLSRVFASWLEPILVSLSMFLSCCAIIACLLRRTLVGHFCSQLFARMYFRFPRFRTCACFTLLFQRRLQVSKFPRAHRSALKWNFWERVAVVWTNVWTVLFASLSLESLFSPSFKFFAEFVLASSGCHDATVTYGEKQNYATFVQL